MLCLANRPRYNVAFDACLSDKAVSGCALPVHFASILLAYITSNSFKGHVTQSQKFMITKYVRMGALPYQI